jgi:O-antigen/teichoic acid export membrane protein
MWLWMDMKVQTETGESYGAYFPLISLSSIFSVLLDLGISNYNNRKIAAHPARFKNYFSSITAVRIGLAILFTGLLLLIGIINNYSEERLILLIILGLNQVLLASILYIRSNFTALGKFKTDSFFSVLDRILMILGVGWFLFGIGSITIEKFVLVQFFGYLVAFVVSAFVLVITGKASLPKLNIRFSKTLIKKSAPYAVIVLLMSAYNNSDSIMIDEMLENGAAENSLYAQSFRVLTAMNNYAYLFAVLLLPVFSKMLKKKESVAKLLSLSGGMLIYGVSAFVIVTIQYRVDILSLCYGDYGTSSFFESGKLLNEEIIMRSQEVYMVLILGIIPMSFNYCYGVLITASGKMGVLNRIAGVSLLFNLIKSS